jgi:hypothetical protein
VVDPVFTLGVVLVEKDEEPAGSEVPIVGGSQIESSIVEEVAASQEKDPAMSWAQTDIEVDVARKEAADQGELPEEEKED